MPRGKYVNHKGRRREFTSAYVLQRELDRFGKPLSLLINYLSTENQMSGEDEATQRRRLERKKERMQSKITQRSKETLADLARLALVRKE
ncbi:GM19065 [Drosophila sechellia]|uniref:GM19065 n=1 Tax=Drosophila sechellia TaxID=7238 RepID=B4I920_DROSE|nr:GM19065 [Drosophila sechellia]